MQAINLFQNPLLTLVGAGPGDPELITLKGVKALSSAKVVLYDALVHTDLLEHAPENCVKILVGKRSGKHSFKQSEINELIVKYAYEFGSVVRLKGGDPFVFGRGSEEIEYAEKFGIASIVIPGLSCSTSLPGLQGMPLTKRGVNESFWVVTGTTEKGGISPDFYLAAQSSATVVVLMGRNKLHVITEFYKSIGKDKMPIAVIHNGSLKSEKTAIGSMNNIESLSQEKNIGTPSILVIGEVVKERTATLSIANNIIQQSFKTLI
ncbi:MAG TPA: uroporphyrinogen-III C-methyltransferase [Flavobacteriales bacterium]|nr:uroporphyrinogen-III C-methyltransferase [Flavobacteriales bacterium]HIN41942.1 uroporphyrinogen-III C-methyltransferase [Flavobacteriales bacterium]